MLLLPQCLKGADSENFDNAKTNKMRKLEGKQTGKIQLRKGRVSNWLRGNGGHVPAEVHVRTRPQVAASLSDLSPPPAASNEMSGREAAAAAAAAAATTNYVELQCEETVKTNVECCCALCCSLLSMIFCLLRPCFVVTTWQVSKRYRVQTASSVCLLVTAYTTNCEMGTFILRLLNV